MGEWMRGKFGWIAFVLLGIGFMAGVLWSRAKAPTPPTTVEANTLAETSTPTATSTRLPTETPTIVPSPTRTQVATTTPSPAPSATEADAGAPELETSGTPSATATPLRAQVRRLTHCRYGPDQAYMEERVLYPGETISISGRDSSGSWLYVKPPTYLDSCWLEATEVVPPIDALTLPVASSPLPRSDLYSPPKNIEAVRSGDQVMVAWDPLFVTPQDERGYLFEAWLCRNGVRVFTVEQTYGTSLTLVDEAGCGGLVGARLYTAELHGYSRPAIVWWPLHPSDQ